MSRYGSVTISSPTSVVTRIVQSAEPGDLQDRTNAAISSLPAGYIVVGLTLAGAGDGHTFTVTVEAGLAQDATGGFLSPPAVTCFLASEAEALLLARQPAGPQVGGVFADTQVAGASKGTRFMGMVVNGSVAGGAAPLPIVAVDGSDTTPGFLTSKLAPGANVSFTVLNPGGNEQLLVDAASLTHQAFFGQGFPAINSLVPGNNGTATVHSLPFIPTGPFIFWMMRFIGNVQGVIPVGSGGAELQPFVNGVFQPNGQGVHQYSDTEPSTLANNTVEAWGVAAVVPNALINLDAQCVHHAAGGSAACIYRVTTVQVFAMDLGV
jgi:hypothetical protein